MKNCEWCEKPYEPTGNAQKYCCTNCNRKAHNARMYNKDKVCICEVCEKEFTTLRRKSYCSNACRMVANGRGLKEKKAAQKKTKPKMTLAQVNALARAEGLTYGQYMARHYI